MITIESKENSSNYANEVSVLMQRSYEEMENEIQKVLEASRSQAPEAFGSRLQMGYLPGQAGDYCFTARTQAWMCNPGGMVHGGVCAGLMDQAMGVVVYCMGHGKTINPTINLQIQYHRPLLPEADIWIRVRPVSVTRQFITLAADIVYREKPEKICCSSTATFFCKDPVQGGGTPH